MNLTKKKETPIKGIAENGGGVMPSGLNNQRPNVKKEKPFWLLKYIGIQKEKVMYFSSDDIEKK